MLFLLAEQKKHSEVELRPWVILTSVFNKFGINGIIVKIIRQKLIYSLLSAALMRAGTLVSITLISGVT